MEKQTKMGKQNVKRVAGSTANSETDIARNSQDLVKKCTQPSEFLEQLNWKENDQDLVKKCTRPSEFLKQLNWKETTNNLPDGRKT